MRTLKIFLKAILVLILMLSFSACITSNYSSNDEQQKVNLNESFNLITGNSNGKIVQITPVNERYSEVDVIVTEEFIGSVMLNTNWNTNFYGEFIEESIKSSGILGSNIAITIKYYDLSGKIVSIYSSEKGPTVYYKFD
ncbi:conserved hypothetical protein [Methanococcus vannielii SB]|uniref:Lipoprotein n=1 Tax=Methanococcus vannielii (strain ATCC 35089 / DSM 1224 / JCM 13029 / OCM 148 / SB) TaxID=406327 RepID=A6UNY5_METVS|nr:hypothetical protein [Methanococcus vannielii]ABR54207.1 conserved hypothetical protein [Methanococcus vannielii SB]